MLAGGELEFDAGSAFKWSLGKVTVRTDKNLGWFWGEACFGITKGLHGDDYLVWF